MKRVFLGLVALAILFTTGCAFYSAPVVPPQGVVYAHVSAPIDTDADVTPVSMKTGEASSEAFLGLVARGDASIQAAASNGGIRTIHHVDYEYKNIFFWFYQKFTIRVYGE